MREEAFCGAQMEKFCTRPMEEQPKSTGMRYLYSRWTKKRRKLQIERGKTRVHVLQYILSFHVPKRPAGLRGLSK